MVVEVPATTVVVGAAVVGLAEPTGVGLVVVGEEVGSAEGLGVGKMHVGWQGAQGSLS